LRPRDARDARAVLDPAPRARARAALRRPALATRRRVSLTPRRARLAVGAGIALVTLACFTPALRGDKTFTNWDDRGYVTEQPLVRSLAPDNLRRMFDPQTDVMLNYHPLTMLSLAIEQHFVGRDSARPYAATNVALHVVNTLLVLALVARL